MASDYEIRRGTDADAKDVVRFIEQHWSASHIFVEEPGVFSYQYCIDNAFNFYLGRNVETMEIEGILGFINYDPEAESPDIFLALWKVIRNCGDTSLGTKLLSCLFRDLSPSAVHCNGINANVARIYEFLGFKVGKLEHYFYVNSDFQEFKIGRFSQDVVNSCRLDWGSETRSDVKYLQVSTRESLAAELRTITAGDRLPTKSADFLTYRYLNHPYYSYLVCSLRQHDEAVGIAIFRKVPVAGRCALRLIDYIGPLEKFSLALELLKELVHKLDCEYGDSYSTGISEETYHSCKFIDRLSDDVVIVPNYFEPFEKKNVDIFYASTRQDVVIFKGDGDQDRPNKLEYNA